MALLATISNENLQGDFRRSGRPAEPDLAVKALARLLQQFGPQLGRPRVDTLNGSRHSNMKELRFSAADGEWRVAFAFDTKRKAILLVAGDKSGAGEKRIYRELIRKADDRFDAHLAKLMEKRKQSWPRT